MTGSADADALEFVHVYEVGGLRCLGVENGSTTLRVKINTTICSKIWVISLCLQRLIASQLSVSRIAKFIA